MAETMRPATHISATGANELLEFVGSFRNGLLSSSWHGKKLQQRVSVSRPNSPPCLPCKREFDRRHSRITVTAVGTSTWKDRGSRRSEGITPEPSLISSSEKKDENGSNKQNAMGRRSFTDLAALFCDHIEKLIYETTKGSTTHQKGKYFLSGNFAPATEKAPTTAVRIIGAIPKCMFGEFLRIGPNPRFEALGGYHLFDGDGMIHGLHLSEGKATYVVRYVRTSRLQQEEHYGAPKFFKIGDLKGLMGFFVIALENFRRFLGVLNAPIGFAGTANTSLIFHNKKLMALHEQDKPYIIKVLEDGDLVTVGLEDYDTRLRHSFSAHPKIDPVSGELFFFGYNSTTLGLIYRYVTKEGILRDPVMIKLPNFSIMHDFMITENYAILMDVPLVRSLLDMMLGGTILKFHPNRESRLGVLPRYATDDSQIRWSTIPTCYISHTIAAWEEKNEIILICCRMDGVDLDSDFGTDKMNKAFSTYGPPTLYEYRMNLRNGSVHQRQLSNVPIEFPVINPEYIGRKTRYAYCGKVNDDRGGLTGILKYDLSWDPAESDPTEDDETEGNICGVFHFGEGRYGGESIFVPNNSGKADAAEDDGYLITFVTVQNTGRSEALIIDAKTMAPTPVAVIELPGEIPIGFHACFVTQEQLQQQT